MNLKTKISYLSASIGIVSALAAVSFLQCEKYHNYTPSSAFIAFGSGMVYNLSKKKTLEEKLK